MSFGGQRVYTLSDAPGLDPFLELCPMYGSGNLVIFTDEDTDKPRSLVILNKEMVGSVAQYLNKWLEHREKVDQMPVELANLLSSKDAFDSGYTLVGSELIWNIAGVTYSIMLSQFGRFYMNISSGADKASDFCLFSDDLADPQSVSRFWEGVLGNGSI